MVDRGIEIIQKRRALRNLIDQADAKKKDLYHINKDIEEATQELALLERSLYVDRTIEEIKDAGDLEKLRECGIEDLKKIFSKLDEEGIDMLYKRLHQE